MDSLQPARGTLEDFDLYSYFYSLVRQIPRGKITSYGDLAKALGDIVASRACGYMLSINPDPVNTPCYKVERSSGEVGKFTHVLGSAEKIRRLERDGIHISDGYIENFSEMRFTDFETSFPLMTMKDEQIRMSSEISLEDDFDPTEIAAMDVAYDDEFGYGAMVIKRGNDLEIRESVQRVRFPYIPGYLTYREFRFARDLAKDFRGTLIIDANGYLHPRHIGLASYTGIRLGIPTIGVAKSVLTGKIEGNWILQDGRRSAYLINRHTDVSPSHRNSLDSSVNLI